MGVVKLADKGLVSKDHQREVIELLERALLKARKGELDTAVVIVAGIEGYWQWEFAGNRFTTEMIGRVEIIKHEWVAKFIADENG